MKVRMKVRPTGYVSFGGGPLNEWPKVGAVVDLPDEVAEDMIASGNVEKAPMAKVTEKPEKALAEQVEQRPAPTTEVENRGAKKPAGSGA